MHFQKYGLSKSSLKYFLESKVSEPPSKVNMLVGAKHLWNLHESTFIISFDHSEGNIWQNISFIELWNWLPMRNIPLGIAGMCSSLFKCNYLKNKTVFRNFLFHLWNLHQILNTLEKKTIVIANVFLKLQTVKILVKKLSRKSRFRISFGSQYFNGCQTHLKCAWEQSYQNVSSIWEEMICKISTLLKFQILGVFFKTLTAADKYPVWGREHLQIAIQMQLS